ncbi:hypothetical protein JOB18_006109 [Solea senegalensis]|uniref:Uncharacterized protein n=1 Tax=Solea senegalensis TaxID=28829 RepID=A0AAV6RM52_SOLSE|nr:hypothetical protein JOB18_006109 [Solea senegalensis]
MIRNTQNKSHLFSPQWIANTHLTGGDNLFSSRWDRIVYKASSAASQWISRCSSLVDL